MSTWYEVSRFCTKPRAVEFARETDKFLIRENGMRDAKSTMYSHWYKTEQEAMSAILARLDSEKKRKADLHVRNAASDLLSALEQMCAEFRGYDLPYGSEAYTKAISVINRVKAGE